jgi:hypothetical protein
MSQPNSKVNFNLEQRKVLLSASLVSVIALISLVNQTLGLRGESTQSSRGIASSERFVKYDQSQLQWQKKLAKELALNTERDVASLGHKPSAFEQLRFGFFEGKYAFQLEHGKIKAIDFVDSDFTNDRPKYINDKLGFLKQWKDQFSIGFNKVEKDSEGVDRELVRERYKLIAGGETVGYVQFLSDVHGRAHAIKFENAN